MKQLLTLCLLVFLSTSGFSQYLVQSVKTEYGHTGPWQNISLYSYTYDSYGNRINSMEQEWDMVTGTWKDFQQLNYTYNPDGTLHEWTVQNWNGSTATWENALKNTKTYTSNGLLQSYKQLSWDGTNWLNSKIGLNTYDSTGHLTSHLQKDWKNSLNAYENTYLITYTNNSNGTVQQYETSGWEPSLQSWNPIARHHYTYNAASQQLTDVSESEQNGAWQNGIKLIHTYDANGKQVDKQYQDWLNNSWVTSRDYDFTYYSFGELEQVVNTVLLANLINEERVTYTYITHPSITARPEALSPALALYPNPSADRLVIELPQGGITRLSVIDLQGKTISTQDAFGKVSSLDVSKLSAGTYLLKAETPNGITTSKFTKQ